MRINMFRGMSRRCALILGMLLFAGAGVPAQAAVISKKNGNNLNNNGGWVPSGVPTPADVAIFDGTNLTVAVVHDMGGSLTFGELVIANPGGLQTISSIGGFTLTLNGIAGKGIDMSAATTDFMFASRLGLASNQVWDIASGRTLTLTNIISGASSLSKAGAGTLLIGGAGIVNTFGDNTPGTKGLILSNGTVRVVAGSGRAALGGSGNGALLTINGGSLDLNGTTQTVGVVTGTGGAITNSSAAAAVLIFGTNDTTTTGNFQGDIDDNAAAGGTLTLVKSGTGKITLSGNNTYAGVTTISAGQLNIGAGGTSGTLGTGVTTNDGALVFNRSDSVSYENTLSGRGSVSQLGSGTLTLSGTNTYTGITTNNGGGVLQIGAGGTGGALPTNGIVNNAALVFNRSDSIPAYSGIISGSGSLTQSGSGTLTLAGLNTYTGITAINSGNLVVNSTETAGSSGPLGNSAASNPGSITFGGGTLQYSSANTTDYSGRFSTAANQSISIDTGGQNVTLATALTSSGGTLTKKGSGTLTISAVSTYSGLTTISGGSLRVGVAGAVPGGTGKGNVIANGTLNLNGFSVGLNGLSGTGLVDNAAASVVILAVGSNDISSTYSGTITNSSGALSLVKTGLGTFTLSGTNGYVGDSTVMGGSLYVNNDRALGAAGTPLNLDGGTLRATNIFTFSRTVTNRAAGGTIDVDSGSAMTLTQKLTGTGGFVKAGPGRLILYGVNDGLGPVQPT